MSKQKKKEEQSELLSMEQAIEMLKTTRPTFYRWLRSGKIQGMKVGRQWRFYPQEIERFLKGEQPQIALPINIEPLISELETLLEPFKLEPLSNDIHGLERVVQLILQLALSLRAQDIHLEPLYQEEQSHEAVLRFRIDGILQVIANIDGRLLASLIAQWKMMASCDTHETTKPQEGRFNYIQTSTKYEVRLAFLPTGLGESVVAKLVNRKITDGISLEKLKMSPNIHQKLVKALERGYGFIAVNGPTGCGKTTTAYAAINHMASPQNKTIIIHSHTEMYLPWVQSINIKEEQGFTFPVAIRSALNSDLDILMVGEIKDQETLQLLQQTALTGHLVISQLHSIDSIKALFRMLELSNDEYVLAEATSLIISQRLVRRLCPHCRQKQIPESHLIVQAEKYLALIDRKWEELPREFYQAKGCLKCHNSGYRGRMAIHEALEITPELSQAIRNKESEETLFQIATQQGMQPLVVEGIFQAAYGHTTLAEIMRVMGLR